MALRCNKCHQGEPYLSDTWCLACSSVEALTGELKCGWGNTGTRALATDVLTTAVRQVRALRRLGLAGAGKARARTPEPVRAAPPTERTEAPPEGAGADRVEKREERVPTPPKSVVKDEEGRSKSAVSEYTYEDAESETEALPPSGLKPAPKAAVEKERSEIPRRRTSRASGGSPVADSSRAREDREEREDRREEKGEDRHRSRQRRRSRSRRDHHREGHEDQGRKKKKKRHRPQHRGGSKHQKQYKAADDPYRRFHYQQPGSFWDRAPSPR